MNRLYRICVWICLFISASIFAREQFLADQLPKYIFPSKSSISLEDFIPPEFENLSYAIYPTSPEYNTARLIYNKRFVYFPKIIFVPTTYQELQFVVSVLKQYDLRFALQSGGHCFEPGSLSSDYVISLKNFNSIIPDIPNQQVFVGAGCILRNVIDTLGAIDYAIPTGTCPTVGAAGLTMGGGIGFLSRTYGLTCSSVKSITFLNADSEIIEVTEDSYPDLFWALLGGGNGSYGIALGFTFTMYYIPEITFFELVWEYDPELIIPVMKKWQEWSLQIPDTINTVLGIRHPNHLTAHPEKAPPLVIRIYGLITDPAAIAELEAFNCLDPKVHIHTGSYLDMAQYWSFEPDLPFNKLKSRIMKKPVSVSVMVLVAEFFAGLEKLDPDFLVYFNFERLGGKVRDNKTSFYPKNAFAWWEQAYYWGQQKQNEEVIRLSRKFYACIPKEVSKYCYANIVDYDLGPSYLQAYFGSNVDKLIHVKRKYDPTNLFHWRQSIPLKKRKCSQ